MASGYLFADICRELRAVIRAKILDRPYDRNAVSTPWENGKLTIRIPDGKSHLEQVLQLLSFVDSDYLAVDEYEDSVEEVKIVCSIGDLDELKSAIDCYYEIYNCELYSFDEIKSFVDSKWDVAGWSIAMAQEKSDKTGRNEVVFVLDSENSATAENVDAVLKLDRLLAAKYAFSLRGYTPEFNRTQNAVAYVFHIPHERFEYVKSVEHVVDCEI